MCLRSTFRQMKYKPKRPGPLSKDFLTAPAQETSQEPCNPLRKQITPTLHPYPPIYTICRRLTYPKTSVASSFPKLLYSESELKNGTKTENQSRLRVLDP